MGCAPIIAGGALTFEGLFASAEGYGKGTGGDGRDLPVFLTSVELAQMLKLSPRSVEKMRLEGRGPNFFRLGNSGKAKVLYRLDDVLKWLEQHRK